MSGEPSDSLPRLLQDLCVARTGLREERGVARSGSTAAQEELLVALDAYASALVARGLPIPYALRDELRIYHDLMSPRRR